MENGRNKPDIADKKSNYVFGSLCPQYGRRRKLEQERRKLKIAISLLVIWSKSAHTRFSGLWPLHMPQNIVAAPYAVRCQDSGQAHSLGLGYPTGMCCIGFTVAELPDQRTVCRLWKLFNYNTNFKTFPKDNIEIHFSFYRPICSLC